MIRRQYSATTMLVGAIMLLTACGVANENNGPPATGLWYANRGGTEMPYSLIEEAFASAKACTGLDAPGTKVLTASSITSCAQGVDGCYSDNGVIEIITPESEWAKIAILEHEFIHYLLHVNTGNLYPNHDHDAFVRCDQTSTTQ